MTGASTFPLYDRLYDGRLCETLDDWRAEGLSAAAICDRIEAKTKLRPGRSTVDRWLKGDCK